MQIQELTITRQSSYASHKPNQLVCTVELRDGDNRQTVSLDDHVIVAVLEVIRDATVAQCKSQAAQAKSALEAAIAAPALESAVNLQIED